MKKIIFLTLVATGILTACKKNTKAFNPILPRVDERPFWDYAVKTDGSGQLKEGFKLELLDEDYPTEYGMEFTSSKNGYVYALGIKLPQAAEYTLSLWDATSQVLLWQGKVNYNPVNNFLYVDLSAQGKEIAITKNKKYMAGVFIPRTPAGAVYPAYWFWKPGTYQIMPLQQGNITFTGNYFTKTDVPAFPSTLIYHLDVINGIVDIGFYKTEY